MEFTIIMITFLIVIHLSIKIATLEGRIKGMKYTLDQLANQLKIPENPINDDLRKLIKEEKYVEAVKKARETLGLSLLEGKEYIDKLKFEDR